MLNAIATMVQRTSADLDEFEAAAVEALDACRDARAADRERRRVQAAAAAKFGGIPPWAYGAYLWAQFAGGVLTQGGGRRPGGDTEGGG